LSFTSAIPDWGGVEFRLPIEQEVVFTGEKVIFLDGRQTRFHLVR
jgi:hypothetical protein